MSEPLSRIPSGLRYYSAGEARMRRTIEATAMAVFEGWSYEEIVTPSLDYYSLFEQGMGGREANRTFRFTDGDGRLLALRPDVTSSIARAAVTLLAKCPRPLRLCYSANIFHQQGQSHADWRRESRQIGCELLGGNSIAADLEILAIATELLQRLDPDRSFVITLSDIEIFNGLVASLALDTGGRDELRRLVDIRAIASLESFLSSHTSADESAAFANLIQLAGKGEVFERARRVITNARSCAALDRLENLWRAIESLGLAPHFEIDLGDVSHLDYYTGLTFKIYVENIGGRAGGGGRYDNLTAKFGKAEPAVGFVLEVDALAELWAGKTLRAVSPTHECVAFESENNDVSAVFRAAIERRRSNQRVLINHEVAPCPS